MKLRARVFCSCGHELDHHSTSGRCLLQNADESECACTAVAPDIVFIGDAVYRLVPVACTEEAHR